MTPEEAGRLIAHWEVFDTSSAWEKEHAQKITDAIKDAVAEEREACAKIAESYGNQQARIAAINIRARGN